MTRTLSSVAPPEAVIEAEGLEADQEAEPKQLVNAELVEGEEKEEQPSMPLEELLV